jgi:YD repeat-containing protein
VLFRVFSWIVPLAAAESRAVKQRINFLFPFLATFVTISMFGTAPRPVGTSKTLPNSVAATYTYDGMDRLTRLKDAEGNAVIADNQYSYNNARDITQNIDQSEFLVSSEESNDG